MKTMTAEEFRAFVEREWDTEAPGVLELVNRWLTRGDGAAIYVNNDLGHHELGMPKIVSYGSPDAQLETNEPPQQLPDIGGAINWRYWLEFTYRGELIEVDAR